MSIGAAFAQEMEQEAKVTRKYLDRVTDDVLGWKPHDKSMTLGRLASHVAETNEWGLTAVTQDNFSIKSDGSFKPFDGSSAQEILSKFDTTLAAFLDALKAADDATMGKNWQMIMDGNVMFEMPKMVVVRMWVLNHLVHHRGQLSVYFRLKGIPVPATYGPSADEQM